MAQRDMSSVGLPAGLPGEIYRSAEICEDCELISVTSLVYVNQIIKYLFLIYELEFLCWIVCYEKCYLVDVSYCTIECFLMTSLNGMRTLD